MIPLGFAAEPCPAAARLAVRPCEAGRLDPAGGAITQATRRPGVRPPARPGALRLAVAPAAAAFHGRRALRLERQRMGLAGHHGAVEPIRPQAGADEVKPEYIDRRGTDGHRVS